MFFVATLVDNTQTNTITPRGLDFLSPCVLFYIYGGYGEVVNTSACEVDIRRCESD